MKPIQRTSSSIVDPGHVQTEIRRYNLNGWIVTSAWWVDDRMTQVCLNAIYQGWQVSPDAQMPITIEKIRSFSGEKRS